MKMKYWVDSKVALSGLLLALSFTAPAAISPLQDSGYASDHTVTTTGLSRQELARERRLRCTPGFICGGDEARLRVRVSHVEAVRFALLMGIAR